MIFLHDFLLTLFSFHLLGVKVSRYLRSRFFDSNLDFIRGSFKLVWDLEKRSLVISNLKSSPKNGRNDDLKIIGKARMKIASRENVLDNFPPDIFVKAIVLISLKGQLHGEDKYFRFK